VIHPRKRQSNVLGLAGDGGSEESMVDLRLALSDVQAAAFRSTLYSFITEIEKNRGLSEDGFVCVTIIPIGERTEYVVRFASHEDAYMFAEHLHPSFLDATAFPGPAEG
jgi:hypothetical protein